MGKRKIGYIKPTSIERFKSKYKVNQETGCWEWFAQRSSDGYGKFVFKNGQLAHRYSYLYFIGDLESSKTLVCHKCDNPCCVNPFHLFKGLSQDNIDDMYNKGRKKRAQHGSFSKYSRGCRCVECKAAAILHVKKWESKFDPEIILAIKRARVKKCEQNKKFTQSSGPNEIF